MSKIEVDKVDPQSGTDLELGTSGDTITIPAGVTFDSSAATTTLPDGSVTNDQLVNDNITINGASVSLGGSTTIETGTSWQSSIVTGTTLTAVAGNGYWIDTTSNACTITLPASASVGDTIEFSDYARNWGTNSITINTNSLNFQGNSSPNPVYDTNGQSVRIVYSGATQGWIPTVDDDVTLETPQTYSADFLVLAGGAGGGSFSTTAANESGGGGGAGGFRISTQTLNAGNTYTITVGDGGAGGASSTENGFNGSNSSISGTGLTTITSAGGGGGGRDKTNGLDGGSGGGGGSEISTTGGSGNTPSTTPSQGNDGGNGSNAASGGSGGGGGSSAVGGVGDGSSSGDGGAGTANSITGSSVTYAGGGGGGGYYYSSNVGGTGGTGGGGTGANPSAPTVGTVNTGSGGGGGGWNNGTSFFGAAGGKGVVILSVPTANYSSTTTGSPTVTTSGSNTIIQFNGTGSYTA